MDVHNSATKATLVSLCVPYLIDHTSYFLVHSEGTKRSADMDLPCCAMRTWAPSVWCWYIMVHGAILNLMWSALQTGTDGAHGMLVCMVSHGSRGPFRQMYTFTTRVRLSRNHPSRVLVIIHPNVSENDMYNGKNRVQCKLGKTAETPELRFHAIYSSRGQIGPPSWPQARYIMPYTWLRA